MNRTNVCGQLLLESLGAGIVPAIKQPRNACAKWRPTIMLLTKKQVKWSTLNLKFVTDCCLKLIAGSRPKLQYLLSISASSVRTGTMLRAKRETFTVDLAIFGNCEPLHAPLPGSTDKP